MKKSRLLPLLIAPLILTGCSDGKIVDEQFMYEWTKKDMEVFDQLNAKDGQGKLILMPYDADSFITYVTITTDEQNNNEEVRTYESNYELLFDYNSNKVILNMNNHEDDQVEKLERYAKLVKETDNWIVDETLTNSEAHDYYFYQELAFEADSHKYDQSKGQTHLNLNVYQNDTQMIIALWKEHKLDFASWPEKQIDSYFGLNTKEELVNFVPLTNGVESISTIEGYRSGYPILDLQVKGQNKNVIANYVNDLLANGYEKEDYHPYSDSKDCYYINQSYEILEPGKNDPTIILQSLNVYIDRQVGKDNTFNIRLEVQQDSESA